MKKVGIVAVVLLAIVAVLPIVGNKTVSAKIQERIDELSSHGIEVKAKQELGNYLVSKKHYEFVLKDSKEFVKYLAREYPLEQLPAYVQSVLKGVVLGVDVEYSNIPFFTTIDINLYPVDFSAEFSTQLQKSDPILYKELKSFFSSKGILYHMSYHVSSATFDGYVKDIENDFTTKENVHIKLVSKNTKFGGRGALVAPTESFFNVEKLSIGMKEITKGELLVSLEGLESNSASNENKNAHSSVKLKRVKLIVDEAGNDVYLDIQNFYNLYTIQNNGEKSDIKGRMSFENMLLKSSNDTLALKSFGYDMALVDLDSKIFEAMREKIMQERTHPTPNGSKALAEQAIELLAKGLEFQMKKVDLEDIVYQGKENFGDIHVDANLLIEADDKLKEKIRFSPLGLLSVAQLKANIELSQQIFSLLKQKAPMLDSYAQPQGDKVVFKIELKDSKISVNGKQLQ